MKKATILCALILCALTAKAENDTTLVKCTHPVWESEQKTDKSGKTETTYWVKIDGEYYKTNKTSTERAKQQERFGLVPTLAKITNKSNPKGRIVTL